MFSLRFRRGWGHKRGWNGLGRAEQQEDVVIKSKVGRNDPEHRGTGHQGEIAAWKNKLSVSAQRISQKILILFRPATEGLRTPHQQIVKVAVSSERVRILSCSGSPRPQGIRSPASSWDFSLISYDSFCISYWTPIAIRATTSGENEREVFPDSQNELGHLHSELEGKAKAFTTTLKS